MKIELTRVELPVAEGHRGRKPCEWRIGDFVIPKSLMCSECEQSKITNPKQFVSLLEKTKLSPERLVNKYICRSCRASMKRNDEVVKIGKLKEIKVVEENVETFETTKRSQSFSSRVEIGIAIGRKRVVFYAPIYEFQDVGVREVALEHATEIYDLGRGLCIRHPKKDMTNYEKTLGMSKFSMDKIKTAYRLKDQDEVLSEILDGEKPE